LIEVHGSDAIIGCVEAAGESSWETQVAGAECPGKVEMEHVLKTDPEVFEALVSGRKTYELRRDDRGFAVGDRLTLRETSHTGA